MKVKMKEYGAVFSIDLEAETIDEAAVLTRFGLNKTKKIGYQEAYVSKDGSFLVSVSIVKRKQESSIIRG